MLLTPIDWTPGIPRFDKNWHSNSYLKSIFIKMKWSNCWWFVGTQDGPRHILNCLNMSLTLGNWCKTFQWNYNPHFSGRITGVGQKYAKNSNQRFFHFYETGCAMCREALSAFFLQSLPPTQPPSYSPLFAFLSTNLLFW